MPRAWGFSDIVKINRLSSYVVDDRLTFCFVIVQCDKIEQNVSQKSQVKTVNEEIIFDDLDKLSFASDLLDSLIHNADNLSKETNAQTSVTVYGIYSANLNELLT